MPAGNLLTDDGHLSVVVPPGDNATAERIGAQSFPTMGDGATSSRCNLHVALFFLLAIGGIMLLRRSGIHALMLEG